MPAVLIGYGISVVDDHGFYSSYDARRDIQRNFPNFNNHLDDYMQWAPYLELGAVLAFGTESRNDRVNLALVLAKSEAIMLGSVFIVKNLTKHERPDGSDFRSFPSGHTAQAFLAASIVHTELREKSQWYGIGAYTLPPAWGPSACSTTSTGKPMFLPALASVFSRRTWPTSRTAPAGAATPPTARGWA